MRIPAVPLLVLHLVLIAACDRSPTSKPSSQVPTQQAPDPGSRPQLTAATCEAQGGKVVGDIGDGAIHRPDYRCPDSGQPPIGTVAPAPGGPAAVEGSVCCK